MCGSEAIHLAGHGVLSVFTHHQWIFMLVFQAEHNILMHPFHMLGVAGTP